MEFLYARLLYVRYGEVLDKRLVPREGDTTKTCHAATYGKRSCDYRSRDRLFPPPDICRWLRLGFRVVGFGLAD